jgi:hypothetical protein
MTTQNSPIDATVFAGIATAEKAIEGFKGEAKASAASANDQKIGAYSLLIASLSGTKLVKGNLPRAVSKQVYTGLMQDAGVKEATAKRYLENSVGALRVLEIPTQATPSLVKDILLAENIDSENKLAKRVSGEDDKDPMRVLAEALIGKFTTRKDENGQRVQGVFKPSKFEREDWDSFEDHIRELKAARAAAEDAGKQAEAEAKRANDLANEVFNSL